MKRINCAVILTLIISLSIGFLSCGVTDSEKEWGIPLIYMPQASIQSGGADNNYFVPSGTNEWNKNYSIDNNQLQVVLGVYRSGLQELEAYSIEILAKPDTVTQLIAEGTFSQAMLLPEDTYTLPATITVPEGKREATFYLTIDRNRLLDEYPSYTENRLVLAVGLANPSRYELNQSLSTTIIVVSDEWESME